jgi:nucleoside diphosphate kinase
LPNLIIRGKNIQNSKERFTLKGSIFFIKPDAQEHIVIIEKIILRSGLEIREKKEIVLTREYMAALYGHVPAQFQAKLYKQMEGKKCTLYIVWDNDGQAVERLVEVTGKETAPAKCSKESIRYIFGDHSEGCEHFNVIHRPRTDAEALDNIRLFGCELG